MAGVAVEEAEITGVGVVPVWAGESVGPWTRQASSTTGSKTQNLKAEPFFPRSVQGFNYNFSLDVFDRLYELEIVDDYSWIVNQPSIGR